MNLFEGQIKNILTFQAIELEVYFTSCKGNGNLDKMQNFSSKSLKLYKRYKLIVSILFCIFLTEFYFWFLDFLPPLLILCL